jgi:N-acetylglucosaminyl-diphospho-decaprenol L-rhamnosyltransferase
MTPPSVGISIVNYRSVDDTERLLDDVSSFTGALRVRVVVVDNSAYELPSAAARLRHRCESMPYDCHYLPGRNLGYAGGTNAAIALLARSDVDAVWVLNADIRLVPSSAVALADGLAASRGMARVFATNLRDPVSGEVRAAISAIDLFTTRTRVGAPATLAKRGPWRTTFPEGYSFLLTRLALAKLQFLDDSLFLFYEEAELMTRASWWGIDVEALPGVVVEHNRGVATGSAAALSRRSHVTLFHASRSCVLFYRRHHRWLLFNCVVARALQAAHLALAARPAPALAVVRGILSGLSRNPSSPRGFVQFDG